MDPVLIVFATVGALGVFMVVFNLVTGSRGSAIDDRISRYGMRPGATKGEPNAFNLGDASQRTMASLNQAVEARGFGTNIARNIARADLRLRVGEYLLIWAACIVGVPLAFFVLGFFLSGLQNPLVLLVGALIGFMLPRLWLSRRQTSRLNAFNTGLPDAITLISNSLRAGSSFLQALELLARESRPPVSTEFARVIREASLGLPFEQAIDNMVRRMKSTDLELMATAINIQYQVGGNLAEILDAIAFTIRERVRIKGEIRTLTAQQRLSGYVVGFLPIALVSFLFVAAPQFMRPMFMNPPGFLGLPVGVLLLGLGAFMMFIGFMLIRKIVDIEI